MKRVRNAAQTRAHNFANEVLLPLEFELVAITGAFQFLFPVLPLVMKQNIGISRDSDSMSNLASDRLFEDMASLPRELHEKVPVFHSDRNIMAPPLFTDTQLPHLRA